MWNVDFLKLTVWIYFKILTILSLSSLSIILSPVLGCRSSEGDAGCTWLGSQFSEGGGCFVNILTTAVKGWQWQWWHLVDHMFNLLKHNE